MPVGSIREEAVGAADGTRAAEARSQLPMPQVLDWSIRNLATGTAALRFRAHWRAAMSRNVSQLKPSGASHDGPSEVSLRAQVCAA